MGSAGSGELDVHWLHLAYSVNPLNVVIVGLVARMHKTYIFRSNDQRYIILNGSPLMAGIDHHTDLLIAGWKWKSLNIVCNPIQMGDVIVNRDRKSTRLNSSHVAISYAVFCLKKKTRTL